MNCKYMNGVMLLLGLALWGCSGIQPPSKVMWAALPEYCEVEDQGFDVRLTPQKETSPFYVSFLLTITNKGKADLVVDWNASRYLFNGSPEGMMVFEGIDAKRVKDATVPLETISPGAVFSREIMPMRLIAWSPLKENKTSQRSITPGMLPAGENGIRLSIRQGNGQMAIPLSVRISREDIP